MIIFIVLGIAYFLYSILPFSYKQLLPLKKLPEQYVSYKYPRDTICTKNFVLKDLIDITTFEEISIEFFNEKDSTVIVKTQNYSSRSSSNPEIYTNTYYKLNSEGTIIDSLKLAEENIARLYDGYLINDDSYYTWILDGDKNKKSCEIINRDEQFTKQEAEEVLEALYEASEIALSNHSVFHNNNSYYVSVFFIENQWKLLFGDVRLNYYNKNKYPEKTNKTLMQLENTIEKHLVWNKKSEYINLEYFHKENFIKGGESSAFNPIYRKTYDRWEGIGFMNLKFKEDIIPFKMNLNYELGSNSNTYKVPFRGDLKYYTRSELNFGLLNYYSHGRLYVVKNKEDQNN